MAPVKILSIGIDAGDPAFIIPWMEKGFLPNLAKLYKNGSLVNIKSLVSLSSGCPWITFNTGTSPAKHGLFYYHRQFINGSYSVEKKYADQSARCSFWEMASAEGKRIAVIDVPQSFPNQQLNGIQIVNWGVENPNWETVSVPPDLIKQIVQKYGNYPPYSHYQMRSYDQIDECQLLLDYLEKGIQKKLEISKEIFQMGEWDLFMTVFAEFHWISHSLWHVIHPGHPKHDPSLSEKLENPILQISIAIDKAIGELTDLAKDHSVVIFSVSGIGPNYSGSHLLPEVLSRLGLKFNRRKSKGLKNLMNQIIPARRWGPYAVKQVEDIVSMQLIEKVKKRVPRRLWDKLARKITTGGNDWAEWKAFAIPNGLTGAIRINLKGREPAGIIDPGDEYNNILLFLRDELMKLKNTDSGFQAVEEVLFSRSEFAGEMIDELPDIIVKWSQDAPIRGLESPEVGLVEGINPDRRSGGHSDRGFMIVCGEKFNRVQNSDKEYTIMDLAPTFLELLGCSADRDFDGHSIKELIRSNDTQNSE